MSGDLVFLALAKRELRLQIQQRRWSFAQGGEMLGETYLVESL